MTTVYKKTQTADDSVYYRRDYTCDIKASSINAEYEEPDEEVLAQVQRVGQVVLPFLSLCKPLGQPLSIMMGGARLCTNFVQWIGSLCRGEILEFLHHFPQVFLAFISLATALFAFTWCTVITAGHGALTNLISLLQAFATEKLLEAVDALVAIVNHVLYLSLIFDGGVTLIAISLAVQITMGLYRATRDFAGGRILEGLGLFALGMIRSLLWRARP